MNQIIIAFTLTLFFCLTNFAQKSWQKPFDNWKRDDVTTILTNSPWVKSISQTEAQAQLDRSLEQSGSRPGLHVAKPATIRLYSALTIRQALYRLKQLEAGFDKMDEEQKKVFIAKNQKQLECEPCSQYYIVTVFAVHAASNSALFQSESFEGIKNDIYLTNEKKEKLVVSNFIAPKFTSDLAVFLFKRPDSQGREFLTLENKTVTVNFTKDDWRAYVPRQATFEIEKLILNNKIDF